MSVSKYDYDSLERQYIQGTMSIRELCRQNSIPSWSTVNERAKSREWTRKRELFQASLQHKEMEVMTDRRAGKLEQLTDDVIDVISAAVFRFVEGLQDREVTMSDGTKALVPGMAVTPSDLTKLIDKLLLLKGQPTKREVLIGLGLNANLDITDPSQLPAELLRELAAAARAAGAGSASSGDGPLPRIAGARTVN
jgi:hypothetical protein